MAPSSQSQAASASSVTLGALISKFLTDYSSATPKRCKIIDAYLAYVLVTGVMQVGFNNNVMVT